MRVDRGGNWSASVDLPLNSATTNSGRRQIRVLDQSGREGSAPVTVLAREVTITPAWGAPGTTATVRGKHFPARNDNGSGFNLLIVYDHGGRESLATAETDAGGQFETEIVIPNSASAPSTNRVRVEFLDDDGVRVVTLTSHDVPGAAIVLSPNRRAAGNYSYSVRQWLQAVCADNLGHGGRYRGYPFAAAQNQRGRPRRTEVSHPRVGYRLANGRGAGRGYYRRRRFDYYALRGGRRECRGGGGCGAKPGQQLCPVVQLQQRYQDLDFLCPGRRRRQHSENLHYRRALLDFGKEGAAVILNGHTRNLTCSGGNCWNRIVW